MNLNESNYDSYIGRTIDIPSTDKTHIITSFIIQPSTFFLRMKELKYVNNMDETCSFIYANVKFNSGQWILRALDIDIVI